MSVCNKWLFILCLRSFGDILKDCNIKWFLTYMYTRYVFWILYMCRCTYKQFLLNFTFRKYVSCWDFKHVLEFLTCLCLLPSRPPNLFPSCLMLIHLIHSRHIVQTDQSTLLPLLHLKSIWVTYSGPPPVPQLMLVIIFPRPFSVLTPLTLLCQSCSVLSLSLFWLFDSHWSSLFWSLIYFPLLVACSTITRNFDLLLTILSNYTVTIIILLYITIVSFFIICL